MKTSSAFIFQGPKSLLDYVRLLSGGLLLASGLYLASKMPAINVALTVGLLATTILISLKPFALLVIFPPALLLLNFAPWSGRFIFNEFDLFVMAVLGSWMIKARLIGHSFSRALFVSGLFVLWVFATDFHHILPAIFGPELVNPYYSELHAFKVGKGILYGLLMALIVYRLFLEDSLKAVNALLLGGIAGSFVLMPIILWERGVFSSLFTAVSLWGVVEPLLDFSSSYRVTSLLADMHTGGESYDGILIFLASLNVAAVAIFKKTPIRLLSFMALISVGYCAFVGFTRSTYMALVGIIAAIYFLSLKQQYLQLPRVKELLLVGVNVFAALLLYKFKGFVGIAAFCITHLCAMLAHQDWLQRDVGIFRYHKWIAGVVVMAVAIYLWGSESKWIESTALGEVTALVTLVISAVGSYFLYGRLSGNKQDSPVILSMSVLSAGIVVSLLLGSYQFGSRAESVSEDFKSRAQHWLNVVKSSEGGLKANLIGNGLGSFPANYLLFNPKLINRVGSFKISDENLELGAGGDLVVGQRVRVIPNTAYSVKVYLSELSDARLSASLCHRNLLFASNFSPKCESTRLKYSPEENAFTGEINSGKVGMERFSHLYWPTVFSIKNSYSDDPIRVGHIDLVDEYSGQNLLANSGFESGLDYWFFYNDFEHLPWHIKNIYLSVFYQVGLIGLVVLAFLLFSAVLMKTGSSDQNKLHLIFSGYLVGVLLLGLFSDPFDSAHASVPFITLLFLMLFMQGKRALSVGVLRRFVFLVAFIFVGVASAVSMPAIKPYWETFKFHSFTKSFVGFSVDTSGPHSPVSPAPGLVTLDGNVMESIAEAFYKAKDNSIIRIAKGYYNEAAVLRASNVKVFAEEGAVIYGKAARGKGALLVQGDNAYIEGIECHSVKVSDNNGACVRFEGSGLVLKNVYFHHAQTGLLGSNKAGDIIIEDSRFEHLGYGVFAHGIYTFEPTRLFIDRSAFINNRNGGHEIKSRSSHTEIRNSIVASPNSRDSRLVDIPNGGSVLLKGNVFVEGPYSENHALFSWGVEGIKHETREIVIEKNLIVSDKPYAKLIDMTDIPENIVVRDNLVVGDIEGVDSRENSVFSERSELSLPPAPLLPSLEHSLLGVD